MCAMRLDVMDESCCIGNVLNDEEKIEVLNTYVDLINLIDCLTDWRKIFDYNCSSLEKAIKKTNIIRVNSDLMACLSSGVSLITVLEHILKMDTSDSDLREKIISKEYDNSFSYRFMYFMRNFTQHSSIPIKYINNVYSFDVYNILNINHFSIKKDIKEDLNKQFDIMKNQGVPYLDLEPMILAYEKSVYCILNEAYFYIESILKTNRDKAYIIINENQQFIYNVYGDNSFCWKCGDKPHALPIKDNPLNLCKSEKKRVIEKLNSIANNCEKVKRKYCAIVNN